MMYLFEGCASNRLRVNNAKVRLLAAVVAVLCVTKLEAQHAFFHHVLVLVRAESDVEWYPRSWTESRVGKFGWCSIRC